MISLPSDLQLEVAKLLDPYSIYHLQLACKCFYDLVEHAGAVIWRQHQLARHCERNHLFWPSFSHLSTTSESKHAATAPMRFSRSYGRIISGKSTHVKAIRSNLQLGLHDTETRELERYPFSYHHLIRGGRFLLSVTNGVYEVWDIENPATPTLAFSHAAVGFTQGAYNIYTNSPTDHTLQYIWMRDTIVPAEFSQPAQDFGPYRAIRWQLIEMNCNKQGKFSAETFDFVLVYPFSFHEMVSGFTLITGDGKVVFQFGPLSIVWDYARNTYTGWAIVGGTHSMETFLVQDHLVYISANGVFGVRIDLSGMTHIQSGFVSLTDQTSRPLLGPSFFLPYEDPYVFEDCDVLAPDICRPQKGAPDLIFGVKVGQSDTRPPVELHQYRFLLDSSHPDQSNLQRLETIVFTYPDSADWLDVGMFPNYHQPCNGRFGVIWGDHLGLFDGPQQATDTTHYRQETRAVPFVPLREPTDKERLFRIRGSFCPASARAVLLTRERPRDRPGVVLSRLELFEFV